MTDHPHYRVYAEAVDQLIEAAAEYWGDDGWAIRLTLWTDGDRDAHAYKSHGRNEEGQRVEERLYVTADGVCGERRVYDEQVVDCVQD